MDDDSSKDKRMISRLFNLWDKRQKLITDFDKVKLENREDYDNIQLELLFLEGKYERMIRFLHKIRQKSCDLVDCISCDARELLIDLGEEVPLGRD